MPLIFGEDDVARPELRVPRLAAPPSIDGRMEDDEWAKAAVVTGFVGPTGTYSRVMTPKDARIYLAHDDDNVYVGVWMELAAGEKPRMQRRRRDSQVYMDRHQFELWFTPPTDGHTKAYQIIGNAYGAFYDMEHVPQLGIQNIGWDVAAQFENEYKKGEFWTAELAIPIAELVDSDHYNPEKPWGVMVGVAWPQRSWPYTHGWYSNIETHAKMWLSDSGTTARLLDLSSLFKNQFEPEIEIVNDEGDEATFVLKAARGDTEIDEEITVPDGEKATLDISAELPPAEKKVNNLDISLLGPDGRILMDGQWGYRPLERDKREMAEVEEKPWEMKLKLSYASLNMGARCVVDVLDSPVMNEVERATFRVLDGDGNVVPVNTAFEDEVEIVVDEEFTYDEAEAYIWLPQDIPYGDYTVEAALEDGDGEPVRSDTAEFTHRDYSEDFAWMDPDYQYGTELTAAKPYEPLEREDDTFRLWGRRYRMDGALPAAMSSQEEELLAGPVNFVAEIDGEKHPARISKPFTMKKADGNKAVFTGSYEVAGIELDLSCDLLFDGGVVYELEGRPTGDGPDVDRLYLSVPVREEVAEYMWTTPGGMSAMMYILDEDLPAEGLIWKSDKVADLVPYVGLCDDERAIQWFADNAHDWIQDEQYPQVQLSRGDGEVEMQVNFVQRAMKGESVKAEFGLIATPVKPLPDGWRNALLHFGNYLDSKVAFFFGPGHGNGKVGPFHWHDSEGLAKANNIDIPEDAEASKHLADTDSGEYPDLAAIKEKMGSEIVNKVRKGLKTYEDPKAVKNAYFHNSRMYFEGNNSKAFKEFFPGDWTEMPAGGWFHLRPVKSYQDFFLFHMTMFARYWHLPAVYYDETYYGPDYNVFNGMGKLMPDGSIRPSYGMLQQREFLYRTRQVMVDEEIPPFIWIHTSGQMAPYSTGAADIAMFGENNTPTPQQDIMDNIGERYMRVMGRAQKFGMVPVWMTMAGRGGPGWAMPGRQTFGWCWMHDTVPEVHTSTRAKPVAQYRAQWGIGEDDVQFQGYWQEGGGVDANDDKYRASYWTRSHDDADGKRKVLIHVMNMHYPDEEDDSTVEVTIDPEELNLPNGWKVYNLESMPQFLEREEVLTRYDRETNNGYEETDGSPSKELGRNLFLWNTDAPYRLDELDMVSDGETAFTIKVPARNFLSLIVE
ncbi:MAG: hypothetical protein ACOCUY_00050 [Verrucomicrobiota bacterium]